MVTYSNKSGDFGTPPLSAHIGLDSEDLDQPCQHELLEQSRPQNMRGGAHALVCNCPKCSVVC